MQLQKALGKLKLDDIDKPIRVLKKALAV